MSTPSSVKRVKKQNAAGKNAASNEAIAREAWKGITDLADTLGEGVCDLQGDTRFIAIILSAIDKAAEQARKDGMNQKGRAGPTLGIPTFDTHLVDAQ